LKAALRRLRVWVLACLILVLAEAAARRVRTRRGGGSGAPTALLIGAYGNGNYGDDAIGIALVRSLVEAGAGPVRIVGRRPEGGRIVAATGAEFAVAGDGFAGLVAVYRAAVGHRVAVLGGGGLLEGRRDNVHVHRLVLEYVGKVLVARLRGDAAYVHGIGVSPGLYSDRLVSKAVTRALRVVDGVSVRDRDSQLTLTRLGIEASLVLDPAFPLLRDWVEGLGVRPGTVGFVGLDAYRWPDFSGDRLDSQREAELGRITELLAEERGASIELHPFHASDVALIEDLARHCRGTGALDPTQLPYPVEDAATAFQNLMSCERIFTMRFHPALAALAADREVEIIGGLQKLVALRQALADGSRDQGGARTFEGFARAHDVMASWLAGIGVVPR
jgi:polysaccharide pyruvyl transferase WcaK-like protein